VLFPALSRLAARSDLEHFRETLAVGVRQIGFLLVPAGAVSAVLAEPIVRIVYQRGSFTADQTTVVAGALAAFSLGLVFNGWMLMLNRAFFSLQSNWFPTIVALANLGLNAALDAAFYRVGVWGIPLATSLVNVAGAFALAYALRSKLGPVGLGAILDSLVRVIVASGVAAGLAFLVWWGIDDAVGRSFAAQIVSVGVALIVAGVGYVGTCRALRIREVEPLLGLLRHGRPSA
jgi:putative peptidoglycan lipid II flippase